MGVFMAGFGLNAGESVTPDLIIAAHAMKEVLFGECFKGAVERHFVDIARQTLEDHTGAQGRRAAGQDLEHHHAHGRSPEAGVLERLSGWSD